MKRKRKPVRAKAKAKRQADTISNLTELARYLTHRFSGRITIKLNKQCIDDWRSGRRLFPVTIDNVLQNPPPLPRRIADWVPQQYVDWVEKWIMPLKGTDVNGHTAPTAKARKQELEIRALEREEAVAEGKLRPVADFEKWIDRLRECFKTAIVRELEGTLVRELSLVIDSLPLAEEQRATARVQVMEANQRAVDGVLKAWSREVMEIGKQVEPQTELKFENTGMKMEEVTQQVLT